MSVQFFQRVRSFALSLLLSVSIAVPLEVMTVHGALAGVCMWKGNAPACNGKCPAGFTMVKKDKKGIGTLCVSGWKAYCCSSDDIVIRGRAPTCNGICQPGETTIGYQKKGANGNKCLTGQAAMCLVN